MEIEVGCCCCCCWTSRNDMRKGWLAAIFCITESSRRSVSTLAIMIRRPLIIAAVFVRAGEAY